MSFVIVCFLVKVAYQVTSLGEERVPFTDTDTFSKNGGDIHQFLQTGSVIHLDIVQLGIGNPTMISFVLIVSLWHKCIDTSYY